MLWWNEYQIIQCRGCENVAFRWTTSSIDNIDPATGQLDPYVMLYPDPRTNRTPIPGMEHFPGKTRLAYLETLKALDSNLPLLTAIGLRTVIESICLEQKVAGHNLQARIDQLAAQGHLSNKQADFLHNHRFMGNVAAHEIDPAPLNHLAAALDIAETLLKAIYILPHLADQIAPKPEQHTS